MKVTVFIVEETVLTFKMNPETDIKMSNIPKGYAAKITDTSEMTVLIRGLDIAVGELDEVSALNPTVDLTNAKKGENELPVHFTLPEGVEQIGTVKVKVKLVEEQEDTKETE